MIFKRKFSEIYNDKFIYRLGEIAIKTNALTELHKKTFLPYKNYCEGRDVVICGAGPSLKNYKPLKDAVHIALNRSFLFDKVKFDFIFCQDFDGIRHVQQEFIDYEGNNCVKLLGRGCLIQRKLVPQKIIPESLIIKSKALPFIQDNYLYGDGMKSRFSVNLETEPIGAGPNVAFAAMNFAAYMNPKTIYLVGCDMSGGHFSNKNQSSDEKEKELKFLNKFWKSEFKKTLELWKNWKKCINIYYPDIKIISINPVGLKGVFEDFYQ